MKPPGLLDSSLKGRAKYAHLNSTSEKQWLTTMWKSGPKGRDFSNITKIVHLVVLNLGPFVQQPFQVITATVTYNWVLAFMNIAASQQSRDRNSGS